MHQTPTRGRPSKYSRHDNLLSCLLPGEKKRPTYISGIGVFRGQRDDTVWVKISLRNGGVYHGKTYPPGAAIEIKLGSKKSWDWKDSEEKRQSLQRVADRGEPLEPRPELLFKDHAKDWLANRKDAKSYFISSGIITNHLNPTFGNVSLKRISRKDINRWISTQAPKFKRSTLSRHFTTLKSILNDAIKDEIMDKSPARHVDPISGVTPRQRCLTTQEIAKIFEAADALDRNALDRSTYKTHEIIGWLRDYLTFALHSGMRRQEILHLNFGDFEPLDARTRVTVRESKNGSSRCIDCTEDMISIRDRMLKADRLPGDNRLFPLSLTTVKRRLTRLWKVCGVKDVRLHDFRRTHISWLVKARIDLVTIAYRVGHKDLRMLQSTYAVFQGDEDASDMAQKLFGHISANNAE